MWSVVIIKSTETNNYYLNIVQLITGFTKQYQKDWINNKKLQRFIVDIYCDVTQGAIVKHWLWLLSVVHNIN